MGGVDQVALVRAMERHYARLDPLIARCRDAATADLGVPPSCSAGCDHCCYLFVVANFPEVLGALSAAIANGWRPNREEIERQFAACHDTDLNVRSWHAAQHPCPFLQDHRCLAYALRPTNCRSYFVYGDPVTCTPPTKTVRQANTSITDGPMMIGAAAIATEIGFPIAFAPIPFLLPIAIVALTDADEARRMLRECGHHEMAGSLHWVDVIER